MSVQLIFNEKGNYTNIDVLTKKDRKNCRSRFSFQCIGYATVLNKSPVRHIPYGIYNPAFKQFPHWKFFFRPHTFYMFVLYYNGQRNYARFLSLSPNSRRTCGGRGEYNSRGSARAFLGARKLYTASCCRVHK